MTIAPNPPVEPIAVFNGTSIRLQQIVMRTSQGQFLEEVNGLLLDGWRVVPGTFSLSTHRSTATASDKAQYVDQSGHVWRQMLFITLERDEVSHGN